MWSVGKVADYTKCLVASNSFFFGGKFGTNQLRLQNLQKAFIVVCCDFELFCSNECKCEISQLFLVGLTCSHCTPVDCNDID